MIVILALVWRIHDALPLPPCNAAAVMDEPNHTAAVEDTTAEGGHTRCYRRTHLGGRHTAVTDEPTSEGDTTAPERGNHNQQGRRKSPSTVAEIVSPITTPRQQSEGGQNRLYAETTNVIGNITRFERMIEGLAGPDCADVLHRAWTVRPRPRRHRQVPD
jgi:hypothetical protein